MGSIKYFGEQEEENIFWRNRVKRNSGSNEDILKWKNKLIELNRNDQNFLLTLPSEEEMEVHLANLSYDVNIPSHYRQTVIDSVMKDIYDYSILSDLKRPKVTTIWVYGNRGIEYAEGGEIKTFEKNFHSVEEVYGFIERKLANTTFRYARNIPEIDTILPDGSRLHIMQGSAGISQFDDKQKSALTKKMPMLTVRRFSYPYNLGELVKDKRLFLYLSYLPKLGESFVIAGNQGAGKTVHLNALTAFIEKKHHLIVIEEGPEMQPLFDGIAVRLWNQGESTDFNYVNMIRNTKATLRMTGDVMMIGEIRDEDTTWEFLRISNIGLHMVGATLHANSAKDALFRLTTLGSASKHHPPEKTVIDMIQRGISHVIYLRREGRFMGIQEVIELTGNVVDGEIEYRTVFERDIYTDEVIFHGLSERMKNKIVSSGLSII